MIRGQRACSHVEGRVVAYDYMWLDAAQTAVGDDMLMR